MIWEGTGFVLLIHLLLKSKHIDFLVFSIKTIQFKIYKKNFEIKKSSVLNGDQNVNLVLRILIANSNFIEIINYKIKNLHSIILNCH